MARIYNGLDALGLGQAINNVQNNIIKNRASAIDMLTDGIGQIGTGIYEQMADTKKGDEALKAAQAMGMANAQELRNSMSGADFAKYVMQYKDRADERTATNTEWDRRHGIERGDKATDRKNANTDWKTQHDIVRGEQVSDAEKAAEEKANLYFMGQLFNSLNANDVKDWGKSIQGITSHNNLVNAMKEFATFNPRFQKAIENLPLEVINVDDPEGLQYDEGVRKGLEKIINAEGADKTEMIEEFLQNLQGANNLTYAQKQFGDLFDKMLSFADGKKHTNAVLTQQLLKGKTTKPQRERERNADAEATRLAKLWEEMEKYANDTTGLVTMPTLKDGDYDKFTKMGKANRVLKLFR